MDFFATFIVLFLIIWATWFHFLRQRRGSAKLPPGPYPLPIIGNVLQLGKTPHESLAKLSKTYGPLMSLHLGSIYTVIVSSPEMAREVLQKHGLIFSGRTIVASTHAHDHYKISMAFLPVGDQWRKLRKVSQEQMFTVRRMDMSQHLRQEKLHELYGYIQKCRDNNKVVNLGEAAFTTALNLMLATLFSVQVADYDSSTSQDFKKTFENYMSAVATPNLADFFPALKPIDPQGILKKAEYYFGKLLGFIEDAINQRLESRSKSEKSPKKFDLLETLLDLREESEYDFSIEVIKHLLLDLFAGGSDTTSSTIEWGMTELLLNPDKLSKAKHELTTVIGDNKQVQESDISRLPYLQALVKEIFRLHPAGPFLLPRKSEDEVEVNGYTIPKDTQTIINVWGIGRDPDIWENPDRFEPERFLDSKIDFKGQFFELIPFGAGRRICPGLPLADRMVHLALATLIRDFDWKLEVGTEPEFHKAQLAGLTLRRVLPLMATPIKSKA